MYLLACLAVFACAAVADACVSQCYGLLGEQEFDCHRRDKMLELVSDDVALMRIKETCTVSGSQYNMTFLSCGWGNKYNLDIYNYAVDDHTGSMWKYIATLC